MQFNRGKKLYIYVINNARKIQTDNENENWNSKVKGKDKENM